MKITNIEGNTKLDELSDKIMELAKEYWEEYDKVLGGRHAVTWIKNDSTGEFFAYTRGEFADELISVTGEFK